MNIVTTVQPAVALVTALAVQAPGAALHTSVGTVATSLASAQPQAVTLVNPGTPGPAGQPGNTSNYTAAATVQGHKAVAINADGQVVLADPFDAGQLGSVPGVSLNAASAGGQVAVRSGDLLAHPGWSFTPNAPVFVGAAGALVQAPPEGATWLQVVGWARSATALLVAPQPPVSLTGAP